MTDEKSAKSETSKSTPGISASISLTESSPKTSDKKKPEDKVNVDNNSPASTHDMNSTQSAKKNQSSNERIQQAQKSTSSQSKLSKTAVFALLIALLAVAGIVSLYLKNQQQLTDFKVELTSQAQQNKHSQQSEIKQTLSQQQNKYDQQLTEAIEQIERDNQVKIEQLTATIKRLDQQQPADWLLHEAEYLIRTASRSIWLNQDPNAAIDLLKAADNKIKGLKDPQYLPIRQLIRQDIASLKLMPTIELEETVLSLMALGKQVEKLQLAYVNKEAEVVEDIVLSEDIADWRANLKITWQDFIDNYFTLRPINATVKPLLSPEYQQNLRENLSLKIQLAIWATTEQNNRIYQQTLNDIQTWINEYFDMQQSENQSFVQDITLLKTALISFDYPTQLLSLNAVRQLLTSKPLEALSEEKSIVKEANNVEEVATPPTNKQDQKKPLIKSEEIPVTKASSNEKNNTNSEEI